MKLYIVRHGQTEWNVEKRMQGWGDSPLTQTGIRDAGLLRERIKEVPFDEAWASPLKRAEQTADILVPDQQIHVHEGLKEMRLGSMEGKRQEDLHPSEKKTWQTFWEDPERFQPNGGETYGEVEKRVNGFLEDISRTSSGNVLLVTHTVVIKLLINRFEDRPLRRIWEPPYVHETCLTIVDWDGTNGKIEVSCSIDHTKAGRGW
ncbi:histidine phosphatase family protein [Bacillus daqingensis]|uniref:Histidine phosphatase family protein n=1 Tax=Bacillus daqingensis TaxID=872396 RepID=A0ABV9NRP8_9BACI